MLSDSQNFMREYPYLLIFPGSAIALTSVSLNLFGDGLRDVLDPPFKHKLNQIATAEMPWCNLSQFRCWSFATFITAWAASI